jgi:hypothetical protein
LRERRYAKNHIALTHRRAKTSRNGRDADTNGFNGH